jgi:membrane protease YdiL (CAAX protease family)
VKNSYSQLPPLSKLGIVAFVCLLSLVVTLIVSSVLAIPFFGIDSVSALLGSNSDVSGENIALLKFLQLAQSIGLFIIPSILLAMLFSSSGTSYLKLNNVPFARSVFVVVLIIFVANPIINFAGELNSKFSLPAGLSGVESWLRAAEEAAAELTKLFLKSESLGGLLFNIFLIAIIPAVGEELLFRGVIQRIFTEWTRNSHLAIWVSAILFSALHFQFFGFIPRAILGAMFGYLFVISGNLWLPIIAHFVNNAAAVIAYHFYEKGILNVDPEKIGLDSTYHIAALGSFLLLIVLFWYFWKFEKCQKLNDDCEGTCFKENEY